MITIVDYGLGNILAFQNVYKRLNVEVAIARGAGDLNAASKIILPGVGAFDHAMDSLERSGMRQALDEAATVRRVPVLGVCVGMQILAAASDEGERRGLGWIEGRVARFEQRTDQNKLPFPHMGWNDVHVVRGNRLFAGLEDDAQFYFLHSYYFACARQEDTLATSTYGIDFSCAVHAENVFGVQFHPEKSHHFGTQLLKNFAEL